jgi:hypothetical protein
VVLVHALAHCGGPLYRCTSCTACPHAPRGMMRRVGTIMPALVALVVHSSEVSAWTVQLHTTRPPTHNTCPAMTPAQWAMAGVTVTTPGSSRVTVASLGAVRKVAGWIGSPTVVCSAQGVMTTVTDHHCGTATQCRGYVDGLLRSSRFNQPSAVALSPDGLTALVADTGNHRIRRIVLATHMVSTVAGSGAAGYADGAGASAQFLSPQGVVVTPDGLTALVADTNNHRIRRIVLAGVHNVSTVAGSGAAGYANGAGVSAQFSTPTNVAVTPDGLTALVTDGGSNRIRRIVLATGVVSLLAGDGTSGYANGAGASAKFNGLNGVAVAPDGLVALVSEFDNKCIRRVVLATGVVSLLAGRSTLQPRTSDDGPGIDSVLQHPLGVAVTDGWAVVPDLGSSGRIRKIELAPGGAGANMVSTVRTGGIQRPFGQPAVTADGVAILMGSHQFSRIERATLVDSFVVSGITCCDYTPPTLTRVSISGKPAFCHQDETHVGVGNPQRAGYCAASNRIKARDIVTLAIRANEDVRAPTCEFTSGGQPVAASTIVTDSADQDSKTWTCGVQMDAGDADGDIGFSVTFSDTTGTHGNAGVPVTTVVGSGAGTSVRFDRSSPTLTVVSISAPGSDTSRAKAADIVTLRITASEDIASPHCTFTCGGAPVPADDVLAVTNSGDALGSTWTCSFRVDTKMANGVVGFSISFKDIIGNVGIPVARATDGSIVTFDKTPPRLKSLSVSQAKHVCNADFLCNWCNADNVCTAASGTASATFVHAVIVVVMVDEPILPPSCTLTNGGQAVATCAASHSYTQDSKTWMCLLPVGAGDANGSVGFSMGSGIYDSAGNVRMVPDTYQGMLPMRLRML